MYLTIFFLFLQYTRLFIVEAKIDGSGLPGEYRDVCRNSNDCRMFAYYCSKSLICECSYGFRPDATNETCIGAIGTQCSYDSHCISRAFCKDHTICACKHEFPYVSDDQWACYGEWESSAIRQQVLDKRLFMFFTIVCINFVATYLWRNSYMYNV